MSRFYDKTGKPMLSIPTKDQSKMRPTTITDAKKFGWFASVTTITALASGDASGLINWDRNIHLDAAVGTADLLASNHARWKQKVAELAEPKLKAASRRGSGIHSVFEAYHKVVANGGKLSSLNNRPAEYMPYLVALHQFCEEHKIRPKNADVLEQRVVLPDARAAGTCDFEGKWGKDEVIVDWKTQNVKKYPFWKHEWRWQLAAYWKGLGAKGKRRIVSVIFDTSGHDTYDVDKGLLPAVHFRFYESPASYYAEFLMLSKLYYSVNEWEEKEAPATAEEAA